MGQSSNPITQGNVRDPEKILLLYGHHRGATGSLIDRALRRRAEIFAAGPGHPETETSFSCASAEPIDAILKRLPKNFQPDVILLLESGVKFFPNGLADCTIPCWFYAIDPHLNLHWQLEYAKLFDGLFVSFEQFLAPFLELGHPQVHWLPHGFDDQYYRNLRLPRDVDVAFVGDMDPQKRPQRAALLEALKTSDLNTVFTTGIWNEEVARLYSRSLLVFNDNDSGVFNPRNFEGSACGAVVLANKAVSLQTFFTPGEDILLYENETDLVAQARAVARSPDRWERLSQAAMKTTRNNTWNHRAEMLLKTIGQSPPGRLTTFSHPDRAKAHAFVYFHRGLPGQTIDVLERLERDQVQDGEILLIKALAYLANDFPQQGEQELLAILDLDPPPQPSLLQQISDILISVFERTRNASGAARAALALPSLSFTQKQRLARILSEDGTAIDPAVANKLDLPSGR